MTCLPVHRFLGLSIAGGGIHILSDADITSVPGNPQIAINKSCWNSSNVKKVFLHVSLTPDATWSWMRPRRGLPLVGTMYWLFVLQIPSASARASSFYNTVILIWK